MVKKTKEKNDKKIDTKKVVEMIKETTEEFVELLGVDVQVEVAHDKQQDAFIVNFKTEDEAGLLIGNRGETINAIQLVLGIIASRKVGEWVRVLVNVADWREKEEKRLEDLANQAAERALATGQPQPLYQLKPAQRRIVHMFLSKNNEVETESQGEGVERYLVVLPKSK